MNIRKFSAKFLSLLLVVAMLLTGMTSVISAAGEKDTDDTKTTEKASDTKETTDEKSNEDGEDEEAEEVDPEKEAIKAEILAEEGDDTEEEEEGFNYLGTAFSTADEKLASMQKKVSAYGYEIYCDEVTGEIALRNTETEEVLFSNPYDLATSKSSDDIKGQLLSQLEIRYTDSTGTAINMYSYKDAAKKDQITVKNLKNGVRVEYSLGDEEVRYLVPMMIEKSRYEELIYSKIKAIPDANAKASAIKKFDAYYVLKDPNDTENNSEKEINEMKRKYKVTNDGMAVYVFDTDASTREYRVIEKLIKQYCPEYTFAILEEDHQLTGYTSTQKAPPLFKMALEYYLDENGLQVRLPANGIRFDEDEYKLQYVRILPYFGAGSNDYNGYTFLPDGSGALFDFQQLKSSNINITGKVYGTDYSYHEIGTSKSETMRLPVYGVVENYVGQSAKMTTVDVAETVDEKTGKTIAAHTESKAESYSPLEEDRGYFAIIEEGDSLASITTTHGGNLHKYNSVYAEFNPRPSDSYKLSDSVSVGDNTVQILNSKRKYTGSYRIRIVMLTDEDKKNACNTTKYYPATYMGMADAYRDYLVDEGVLTQRQDNSKDIPLYIESFGAIDTEGSFLSIPVTVQKALTTFDNLKTMYEDLSGEGIRNINFRLTGFVNGGMESTAPSGVKFEKSVGGDEGYSDFIRYANEKGIGVYPEFDLSYNSKDEAFDGYSASDDAVKTMDGRYTQKRVYRSSYQTTLTTGMVCVSPSVFNKFYSAINEDLSKLGNSGISLSDLGTDLNSDFDEKDSYNREDSKDLVQQLLEAASEDYNSVMVDGGNAYTWKYADTILNVSLDSSHYTNASRSVPFIGLVLHSYLNFAGSPTNMASDSEYETLKILENGSMPYFTLSYQNTPLLKDNETFSSYYSVQYEIWRDDLVKMYKEINELTKDLQNAEITDHKFIKGTRVAEPEELLADEAEVEKAAQDEEKAAKILAEKLARAQALAAQLGSSVDVDTEDEDEANSGKITGNLTSEQIAANNKAKYNVDDGTIVKVSYANGRTFILNYNRFAVTVDGVEIDAVSYYEVK